MPDLKDIILGNIAVERGLVTREALLDLQKQQKDMTLPLGQMMLRAGMVNGPRLIELMKLVNVTIEHLDGGLEPGAGSAEAPTAPGILVGSANEPSKAPESPDGIPVVPAVGGASTPRPGPGPAKVPTVVAPAASKPMAQPGRGDDGPGTKTPKPLPSPFENTPRPVAPPPPAKPRTDRFVPVEQHKPQTGRFDRGKAAVPSAVPSVKPPPGSQPGYKPATEAFNFEEVDKVGEKKGSGTAPAGPTKPKTDRFEAARAGGRTPSEAFRIELAAKEKKSDVPAVQGAFGESVTQEKAKKRDATRLYQPVDLPKETPAGKLPVDEVEEVGNPKEQRISLPPAAREMVAGMKEGMSTPAGKLPAGTDRETGPIQSPLDSKPPAARGGFAMPPGAAAEGAPPKPPSQRQSKAPVAPGSGPLPTAPPDGSRMQRPDDSGFLTASSLPDFEVRASDQPGGKPVVIKNPKPLPEAPKKETRRVVGKAPLRSGLKSGVSVAKPSSTDAKKEGEGEEPKKRSKKLLVCLLVVLALVLGLGGVFFYTHDVTIENFKDLKRGYREIPASLKDASYWKNLFRFEKLWKK